MKKLGLLSGLMLRSLLLQAQYSIGVRAGISNNRVTIDDNLGGLVPDINGVTGFTVGVFSEIALTEHLSFRPELNYARRGFSMNEGFDVDVFGMNIPLGASVNTHLNYIETPLLLQYGIGNDKGNVYGIAGLGLGYAVSGHLQPRAQAFLEWNLPRVNIDFSDDMYNRFTSSGILGLGGSFNTSTGKVIGELRFEHGFNELVDLSVVNSGIRNQSISASVGYVYDF